MLFNALNVWFRDISPAAIKNEPEEDNGFYPSPQHNKASRRKSDDEEFVSLVFSSCTSLACKTIRLTHVSGVFVRRFASKPKKIKTEHDKKSRKRKHEYEEEEEEEDDNEEEEVFMSFFWCLCLHFKRAWGLFFQDLFSLVSGH